MLKKEKLRRKTVSEEKVQDKENVLKRGIDATVRCASSLKRILIAIGTKLTFGSFLRRATAGFLLLLGWLFLIMSAPTIGAVMACEAGIQALEKEETVCENSSNDSQPLSSESSTGSEEDSKKD